MNTKISEALVHVHMLPQDLKDALLQSPDSLVFWEDITLLARNEWICWIESAKKIETRKERIRRTCVDLNSGKRRPCCWPGCPHRS